MFRIEIILQYHADSGGSFEIVRLQGEGGEGDEGDESGALMQVSPLYPSMTEWVADYDPITSLGDANWTVMHCHWDSTSFLCFVRNSILHA